MVDKLSKKRKKDIAQIPEYIDLAENLYRPGLQNLRYSEDIVSACKCSLETGGCNHSCLNRILYIECDPATCPCTYRDNEGKMIPCANTVIQFSRYPKLQVYKTPNSGYALRVMDYVAEDAIICEYRGEVLTMEQSMKRMAKYKASDGFYFAALGNNLVLDASKMGSVARFANHSCDPNSYLQRWTVQGEARIVLTANEPLVPGTEVCYSYNFNDDGFSNNPIKSQKCYCGSPFCTGTVGGVSTMRHDINDAFHYCQKILKGEIKLSIQQIESFVQDSGRVQDASKLVRDQIKSIKSLLMQMHSWQKEAQSMLSFQDPIVEERNVTFGGKKIKFDENNLSSEFEKLFPFMAPPTICLKKSSTSSSLSFVRAWTMEDLETFLLQMPSALKCEEEKLLRQRIFEAQKIESELLQWKHRLFGSSSSTHNEEDVYFELLKQWKQRYYRHLQENDVEVDPSKANGRKTRKRKKRHGRPISKRAAIDLEMNLSSSDNVDVSTNAETHNDNGNNNEVISEGESDTDDAAENGDCRSTIQGIIPCKEEKVEVEKSIIEPDSSFQLVWSEFVSLLRRVFSVLPVRCNHSDWIFTLLDCTDRTLYDNWKNHSQSNNIWLPTSLLNRYRIMYLQPKKSENHHLYSDAMVIAQLWRHYGPNLSLHNDEGIYSNNNKESYWMFSLVFPEYLTHIVTNNALRASALQSLSSLYCSPSTVPQDKKHINSASFYLQDHAFPKLSMENSIFCFCRLPERSLVLSDPLMKSPHSVSVDSSFVHGEKQKMLLNQVLEATTMVQCDGCSDWFHPICCAQRVKLKHVMLPKDSGSLNLEDATKKEILGNVEVSNKRMGRKRSFYDDNPDDTQNNDVENRGEWKSTVATENAEGKKQMKAAEPAIFPAEEDIDISKRYYCASCTVSQGQLPDYAYFGNTHWDTSIEESLNKATESANNENENIVVFKSEQANMTDMLYLYLKHSMSLQEKFSVDNLLQEHSEYIRQWHFRASFFLEKHVQEYLQQWLTDLFFPQHQEEHAIVLQETLLSTLFDQNINCGNENNAFDKKGVSKTSKKLKSPLINSEKNVKKAAKDSKSGNNKNNNEDKTSESHLTIIYKRALQLFMEPYFLIGNTTLTKEMASVLLDLRMLLWLLSTSSMWDILFKQHCIHMFGALTSHDSIFHRLYKEHQEFLCKIHVKEEDKMQITLAMLRKIVHGGMSLNAVVQSFSASSGVQKKFITAPLFTSLFTELTHLLSVTDSLLLSGHYVREKMSHEKSISLAAEIVYESNSQINSKTMRPSLNTLVDLFDLDGRSRLVGGIKIEEDDDLAAITATDGGNMSLKRLPGDIRKVNRPAAHYDLACLFSLAMKNDGTDNTNNDAKTNDYDMSTVLTNNIDLFSPEQFCYWLNAHETQNALTNEGEKEEEEVFCWCRLPDDGVVPMLACDQCNEWFHSPCVRMWSRIRQHQLQESEYRKKVKQFEKEHKKSKARVKRETNINDENNNSEQSASLAPSDPIIQPVEELSFICIGCCLTQGKSYAHAWVASSSSI